MRIPLSGAGEANGGENAMRLSKIEAMWEEGSCSKWSCGVFDHYGSGGATGAPSVILPSAGPSCLGIFCPRVTMSGSCLDVQRVIRHLR